MLTSRALLRRHVSYLKWSYAANRRFTQPAEDADKITINLDMRLAPLPKKKPQREPFVKNFFVGKCDNELLAYPEVLTNERQKQFNEWLAPIEDCVNRNFDPNETDENILPFEAIEQLRELGVFRASLTLEQRGFELSTTEYAKLVEVLGKNPSLASYVASRADPLEMLLKFGSEDQKNRYLPRFISGELIPTFAILENSTGTKTTALTATATGTPCKKYWEINAEKHLVSNGNQANCFIVLANCTEVNDPLHKPENPTVLIAERENGGISSSCTTEKLGQRGLETCVVNFQQTLVPRENLIDKIGTGPNIMINLLTLGKQNVGSQAAAILRRFINMITKHAIDRKHYDKELMSYDFTQEIIAKMTTALFTIESMTYMTTGLIDEYENQDCTIECAIVEAYSARECIAQIYQGLQLLGKEAYLKDGPYERIYRDALGLNLFNGSTIDLYMYIAVMGLHYAGSKNAEEVKKYRNPLMFPKFVLTEMFKTKQAPDLSIEEHVHPSLQVSARMLQECIFMLHDTAATMLINRGAKVTEVHMELRRLAEMAIDIYAMSAVLARASRSYCIGLRHSDDDIIVAHIVCYNGYHRVKINYTEIDAGDTHNCDDTYKMIARTVLKQKGYFPENPLKLNF